MHEYSIVQSLLDIVETNAKKHQAKKIKKVVVKIGVLSGVEPHLLKIAFDTFKEGTLCQEASLEMIIQPIVVKCKSCKKRSEFEKDRIFFECPHCGEVDLEVLDGEDIYVMQLQLEY